MGRLDGLRWAVRMGCVSKSRGVLSGLVPLLQLTGQLCETNGRDGGEGGQHRGDHFETRALVQQYAQ
jgi:hypothetical protein